MASGDRKLAGLLERIDRPFIYIVVALAVCIPLVWPIGIPLTVSKQARDFHQAIENIPNDSVVLFPLDYDPSAMPELYPMTLAALRQMWSPRPDGSERRIRVVGFSLWPAGPPLLRDAFRTVAEGEHKKVYGEDYIELPFKEGREIVMANMASNFHQVFPEDVRRKPVGSYPIMANVRRYDDIAALVDISGGYPGIKEWVQQVVSIYGVKMVGGTTGVSAPEYYPYYQSGQLLGLLEGLKGAAEYEKLVGHPAQATARLDAQSTGHWAIAAFIVLGNVLYFSRRSSQP